MSVILKLIEITRELFDYLVAFRRKVSQATAPNLEIVQHEIEMIFYAMEKKIAGNPKLTNDYRQVKYPLVVLADEIILTSAWSHAKQWEQCLLEKKYFSSNIGGNRFFKLLSKVDEMSRSVVTVFFYCLAFGFKGGFAHNDPSLLRLKGRLLHRILPPDTPDDTVILKEAYRIETNGTGKLPRVWKWRHGIILAVVAFFALLAVQRLVVWPLIMGQSLESALASTPQAPSTQPTNSNSASPAQKSPSRYVVQLGRFSSETLATHFCQQIELKGIKGKIYYDNTKATTEKRYIVLSEPYDTEEEAIERLQKAQKESTLVSEMTVLTSDQVSGDCIYGCE